MLWPPPSSPPPTCNLPLEHGATPCRPLPGQLVICITPNILYCIRRSVSDASASDLGHVRSLLFLMPCEPRATACSPMLVQLDHIHINSACFLRRNRLVSYVLLTSVSVPCLDRFIYLWYLVNVITLSSACIQTGFTAIQNLSHISQ